MKTPSGVGAGPLSFGGSVGYIWVWAQGQVGLVDMSGDSATALIAAWGVVFTTIAKLVMDRLERDQPGDTTTGEGVEQ